jgi:glycosyltransferase involved in cell wall biosynthesis
VNPDQLIDKSLHTISVSAVIPTCNRKKRLLSLLQNLDNSLYPLTEVVIVDSGEDILTSSAITSFRRLEIKYIQSEKSVCIQRNIGINTAKAGWIFLCDDDIEVPPDYLQKLVDHIQKHNDVGAVSGLFLQNEKNKWIATYPLSSTALLIWHFIFQLSIWGEINCKENFLVRKIKKYYALRNNHLSKAGWPVLTIFSGDHFTTPLYSLGASLIRKQWLMNSPFDEVLDPYGIGDNYGVALQFPSAIHVLNNAFVFHHRAEENRLQKSFAYYRRTLALDYFRKTKTRDYVKKIWLLWSLFGNLIMFLCKTDGIMIKATLKLIWKIILNKNPYYWGSVKKEKIIQPIL